jgi:hypothetical protein
LCTERPNSIALLYNGGDCRQSDNLQPQAFLCEDYNGGPPDTKGSVSYVVVTDVLDKNITYFRGFVEVGEIYRLHNNGTTFESDQNISIYRSDITTFENLLQTVVYHTSCAINLELNDVFGASQLVEYNNTIQGNVTVFVPVVFDIRIKLGSISDAAFLNSLTVRTNLDIQELTLSEYIANQTLQPGGIISVNKTQFTLDLSRRHTYTLTAAIVGTSFPGGSKCSGIGKTSFGVGRSPSVGVPTLAPSVGPSESSRPTPDPLETKCNVTAAISCSTQRGVDTFDCSQLQPPVLSKCVGAEPVLALEFIYNGLPCSFSNTTGREFLCVTNNGGAQVNPPVPVFITAQDENRIITYFSDIVAVGDTFTISPRKGSRFNGIVRLTVSTVSGTIPGLVLQELKLRVTCDNDDDISLLTQYGSMQLIGFTSLTDGRQSAFESIVLSFTIANDGPNNAIVRNANIGSELFGNRDIIVEPGVEFRSFQSESFEFKGILNLYDAAGQKFGNTLSLNGTATQNDASCSDSADLSVAINM